MSTSAEQMRAIFHKYTHEVCPAPIPLEEVATWAVDKGLFRPQPREITKLCRDALARSLRQEKRVDNKGREYRAKHSVRSNVGGTQMSLWADIDTAPRSFMEKSFSQRRKSIVNDCFQMKQDIDHFNDKNPDEKPLQFIFDFSEDVEEMEAAQPSEKKG